MSYPQRPTWVSQANRSGWFVVAGAAAQSVRTGARGPIVFEANAPALAYALQTAFGVRGDAVTEEFAGISPAIWNRMLAAWSRRTAIDHGEVNWSRSLGALTGGPREGELMTIDDVRLALWFAIPGFIGVRDDDLPFPPGAISIPGDTIRPRFGMRLAAAGQVVNWLEATARFEVAR